MHSTLRIEYDPSSRYCTLHHPYNKRFVAYVSAGITPSTYRKFDPSTKKWSVHESRLPLVVSFGKRCFGHVDYSSLPEDFQIRLVKVLENVRHTGVFIDTERTSSPVGPHAVLFVLETAPWEVVLAAYKALALKTHPDHGGSVEAFQRIQKAYEALKSKHAS